MTKLVISNFSCIKKADFSLGKLTLLIGPQASGKSVICKLHYFFLDILQQQLRLIPDELSFQKYQQFIKDRFLEWFPVSAWGAQSFVIDFKSGDCEIRISRTSYRGVCTDNTRLWMSEKFKKHYESCLKVNAKISRDADITDDGIDFENLIRIQETTRKSLINLLKNDYFAAQVFVPAGRSFFTSMGKAVAAFENSRILDPMTVNFGRLYAQFKDRNYRYYESRRITPAISEIISKLNEIFGGELKNEHNEEYVLSKDGRKIPLSALSSGQQELLPLITVMSKFLLQRRTHKILAYIEEPEAHLFPAAQSKLIECISLIINNANNSLNMVITTHSPYVLSKFNNLIKAHHIVSTYKDRKEKVDKIILSRSQISSNQIKAYAIIDGVLTNIMGDEGLIAADYLDEVSCDISDEFSQLLEIEFSHE